MCFLEGEDMADLLDCQMGASHITKHYYYTMFVLLQDSIQREKDQAERPIL